ncbi:MAG: pantoate--beta-alanine ligase [Planctomycetia bacterium]
MQIVREPARMRAVVQAARAAGRRVGFVPTMGALHAGHASLAAEAARSCDDVAVSIFVNPTQFAPHEDFSRYPRSFDADCALLERQGATWVFAPAVEEIYPPGNATRIVVGGPALVFEGAMRPGHFDGVATVVYRLFHAVPADVAYFGAKDWQQTVVVRRMVDDLALPIEIVVCPTVREPDGLAMSSRNAYLSPEERSRAVALSAGLERAAKLWHSGASPRAIEAAVRDALAARGIDCDYVAVVDPDSLDDLAAHDSEAGPAVVLVAGRLGTTRLIDNAFLPRRPAPA